jgi:hypothetical protein
MSTPSLPAAIPEPVIRFPLRRLLAGTTAVALGAALLGPVYRLAPPPNRSELLACWSGFAAIGVLLALRAWWRTYKAAPIAGPTRFMLLRPDRLRLHWSWPWGFTPLPWYLGFSLYAVIMLVLITIGITVSELTPTRAVDSALSSGFIIGAMFWLPIFGAIRKFHRHRWLRLCDYGVVAGGTVLPWPSIIRCSWHFMHPEQLVLSTWVRPYAADVPENEREGVERFIRAHAPFEDEQPHPAGESAWR